MPQFHSPKPWGYEEMKNPDDKINIGAFRNAKDLYCVFSGEGLLTYA